ncbi:GNAT family N-acetyltransferase [Aquirufa sp. ROCK-SH2]
MEITYQINPKLSVQDLIQILDKSTLGVRRPLSDIKAMESMLEHANVYIGAYDGDKLVGLARCMTDFVYTTYLADLAVDEAYQHHGIGKRLLKEVKLFLPRAKLILLAAPAAQGYYPKIGMQKHEHCFFIDDVAEIN